MIWHGEVIVVDKDDDGDRLGIDWRIDVTSDRFVSIESNEDVVFLKEDEALRLIDLLHQAILTQRTLRAAAEADEDAD